MGRRWLAERAWLGGNTLQRDVLVTTDGDRIAEVRPEAQDPDAVPLPGIALPGLANSHSHAFHRLLRGLTHRRGGDFWAWRDLMYEVAGGLTPDLYEEVATAVFVEMALAGVTAVGEFHYLHHQPGGTRYEDRNEMGHALVRAARRAGIRIALLDAGYLRSGFDDGPLHPVQTRFSDGTVEDWMDRVAELETTYAGAGDVTIGLAPHSVRALSAEHLGRVAEGRDVERPMHIHASEQLAENEACLAATGMTPIGLLNSIGLLGPSTTVVHATHVTSEDISILGTTGTGVCYCPTTERDLADGIGPADGIFEAGSPLTVGSDSHAVIDLFEEARAVETHTRLRTGRRGTFDPGTLLETATRNGTSALGFETPGLTPGAPADFIVVNGETPRTAGFSDEEGAAAIVFSAGAADVTDVFVGSKRIVSRGIHPEWEKVRASLAWPRDG